ncbi:unnamed protein product, partial [Mesorhabditis spiculigera]
MSGNLPRNHDELMVEFDPNDTMETANGNDNNDDEWPDEVDSFEAPPLLPANQLLGRTNEAIPMDIADGAEARPSETLVVDTAALDLEAMSRFYTPFALISRLQFIADHCPPLQKSAYHLMLETLRKKTKCTSRYLHVANKLEGLGAQGAVDQVWVTQTQQAMQATTDALLMEFKRQKDEGVKESTRRAMDDLFHHYVSAGLHTDASRLFNKGMRDYCTQFKHTIAMYMDWLEVALEEADWIRVEPLIAQAERCLADAMEADNSVTAHPNRRPQNSQQSQTAKTNKGLIKTTRARLDIFHGLSLMNHNKYKEAAEKLVQSNPDEIPVPWMVSHSDIAAYGILCALATFERRALKALLAGNDEHQFKRFLEMEPWLMSLLTAWVRSDWGQVLDGLAAARNRLLLDPRLSECLKKLESMIFDRALLLHLSPYLVVDLKRSATIFRCTVGQLVRLSESGMVSVRIDAIAGVAEIPPIDEQQVTYERVLKLADRVLEKTDDTILKALLGQGRIFVHGEPRGKRKTAGPLRHDEEHESGPAGLFGRMTRRMRGALSQPPDTSGVEAYGYERVDNFPECPTGQD